MSVHVTDSPADQLLDGLNPQQRFDYRIVASPTVMAGLIVSPSRNNPLTAIKPGGSGNINATHIDLARGPTSETTRSRISAAALLVNVMASTWPTPTSRAASR